jgi:tetratricopeptide (TPR) repeat protein
VTYVTQVYTHRPLIVLCSLIAAVVLSGSCGGGVSVGAYQSNITELIDAINAKRKEQNLNPLAADATLGRTAQARVDQAAANNLVKPDANPLARIVAAGAYARFAMSHEVRAASVDDATEAMIKNPLAMSKAQHPSLTHIGVAFAESSEASFAVIDVARLVPTLDSDQARGAIAERLREKRVSNSVEPLEFNADLDQKAADMAVQFMQGGVSSDSVVGDAQQQVDGASFALGRVIVTFQVIGNLETLVIPERTSDPALAYAGLGLAQGNHPDHEPGSIAVALFLAEPQTAHDEAREFSNLPPPKAVPIGKAAKAKGSLTDQAWVATLTGNHRKAAKLFEKAFKKKKDPQLLYEAARANARNEDYDSALAKMIRYAELVEGEERKKASEMVAKLENGESIFPQTAEKQLTVEAQRFLMMGQSLFEDGEWDGAIDAFQQAYTYAKHPDIIYNIGLTHVRAGRIGEALNFFEEYQRYVPEATNVEEAKQLFSIGVELYRIGQFEAASRHFAMAYGVLPIPDLVYNLALCHKAMGDTAEAQRLLREFIDSGPSKKERAEAQKLLDEISP